MPTDLAHDYLWKAKGRSRDYWFYRRHGRLVPIADEAGKRLFPGDLGFLAAYEHIHASFEAGGREATGTGTLAHVVVAYKASPDFTDLASKTRTDYGRYLDHLSGKYGHLSVATMPREFVRKLRDLHRDKPRTANYLIQVLRLLLTFAGDQPRTFLLPQHWVNPASRPKLLKGGDGRRPWEEHEIEAFRKLWPSNTFERVAFEIALNTGQRGGDVVRMTRHHYRRGEIRVAQEKTGARVFIPVSADLRAVLDPWLENHQHLVLLPTKTGHACKIEHFRHVMKDAYRAAALPDDCVTHGLRYTAATILRELGCEWPVIADITGHATAEMARKYSEKRRRAALAIERLDNARVNATGSGQSRGDGT